MSSVAEPGNGAANRVRIDLLEKRVDRMEDRVEQVKVEVLIERMDQLEERVDFLIKTLWMTFGSLVLLCFTFLWATAQGWVGA